MLDVEVVAGICRSPRLLYTSGVDRARLDNRDGRGHRGQDARPGRDIGLCRRPHARSRSCSCRSTIPSSSGEEPRHGLAARRRFDAGRADSRLRRNPGIVERGSARSKRPVHLAASPVMLCAGLILNRDRWGRQPTSRGDTCREWLMTTTPNRFTHGNARWGRSVSLTGPGLSRPFP